MRRGWLAPVLFAVVCLAAVVGGYVIGNANATTEAEAADARREATQTAFEATRAGAYAEALNRGFPAGELAGKIEGKRVGAEDGAAAALPIVEREIADTTLTGGDGGGGRETSRIRRTGARCRCRRSRAPRSPATSWWSATASRCSPRRT